MYQTGTAVEVLGNACIAAIIAQVIKFVYFYIAHKKINFKIFTTTGGMPSSHSAGVIALSMTVGYNEGLNSIPFAIALGYAFVVMYDAAGIRRSAGKIAATMNRVRKSFMLTALLLRVTNSKNCSDTLRLKFLWAQFLVLLFLM